QEPLEHGMTQGKAELEGSRLGVFEHHTQPHVHDQPAVRDFLRQPFEEFCVATAVCLCHVVAPFPGSQPGTILLTLYLVQWSASSPFLTDRVSMAVLHSRAWDDREKRRSPPQLRRPQKPIRGLHKPTGGL